MREREAERSVFDYDYNEDVAVALAGARILLDRGDTLALGFGVEAGDSEAVDTGLELSAALVNDATGFTKVLDSTALDVALICVAFCFSAPSARARLYVVGTPFCSSGSHGIWYPPFPTRIVFLAEMSR